MLMLGLGKGLLSSPRLFQILDFIDSQILDVYRKLVFFLFHKKSAVNFLLKRSLDKFTSA